MDSHRVHLKVPIRYPPLPFVRCWINADCPRNKLSIKKALECDSSMESHLRKRKEPQVFGEHFRAVQDTYVTCCGTACNGGCNRDRALRIQQRDS
ncbi:hypothetical protein FKM82_014498 [Ascaphus truei]